VTVTSYFRPGSVPEAIALLQEHGPDLLVIAGGTVAMPLLNEAVVQPALVMGLRRAGLAGIERTSDAGLRIGAMTTLTDLAGQDAIPMLATAARRTASWSVRNMGTVGGNLFSAPRGGDVATALLALDASVVASGPAGTRVIPLARFFTGLHETALGPDELVTAVRVPLPDGDAAFVKLGRRTANSPAVVSVAARIRRDRERVIAARIALGSTGPYPFRAASAEAALVGKALDADAIARAVAAAEAEAEPLEDAVASDWYRRRMVGVVVRRALEGLSATEAGRVA
jgi:aerobic carbon-monoxide dehydrogenase medium subunit